MCCLLFLLLRDFLEKYLFDRVDSLIVVGSYLKEIVPVRLCVPSLTQSKHRGSHCRKAFLKLSDKNAYNIGLTQLKVKILIITLNEIGVK